MSKYKSLKYPCSRITMKCPYCCGYLETDNNISGHCKRCKSTGMIQDLHKRNKPENKSELSDEGKKITGEK